MKSRYVSCHGITKLNDEPGLARSEPFTQIPAQFDGVSCAGELSGLSVVIRLPLSSKTSSCAVAPGTVPESTCAYTRTTVIFPWAIDGPWYVACPALLGFSWLREGSVPRHPPQWSAWTAWVTSTPVTVMSTGLKGRMPRASGGPTWMRVAGL